MDTGIMLFNPDHALTIAAEAIGKHAESTDMAVGIILGIRASIIEYNRLLSLPADSTVDTVKREPGKDRQAPARPQPVTAR